MIKPRQPKRASRRWTSPPSPRRQAVYALLQRQDHGGVPVRIPRHEGPAQAAQPDCFEDLIALVALYRPGPLHGPGGQLHRAQARQEAISYPDESGSTKPQTHTEPTYGIMVYQEQVMQIAQVLAAIPWAAPTCCAGPWARKTRGDGQAPGIFEEGRPRTASTANWPTKVFDLMEKFAGYGFNKSHAAAYALVSTRPLAQDPLPGRVHGGGDDRRHGQHRQDSDPGGRVSAHGADRDTAGRQHRSLPLQRQRGRPHRLRPRRGEG
jgi:hypothetical protein